MGLKWDCPADQTCSKWALSYLMDCICGQRDMISFALGIISIACWAVAEIPQILSNWRSGNVEGVSLAFIFTWMLGDIFNLLGCWISPGTLPTQFYLAVLYAFSTLLLVARQISASCSFGDSLKWPSAEPLLGSGSSRRRRDSEGSDTHLALTPGMTSRSLPLVSNGGRPPVHVTASLPVRPYTREPTMLLGSVPARPVTRSPGIYSSSWRRVSNSQSETSTGSPMLRRGLLFSSLSIVGVTFIALTPVGERLGLKQGLLSFFGSERSQFPQEDRTNEIAQTVGLILGWLMTCIYLTGRLPQIVLNWSRDFVIAVSVPTVVCAFVGNATYLGSILVRGVEWSKLKPVLPWVVDVSFCLLMDCFTFLAFSCTFLGEGLVPDTRWAIIAQFLSHKSVAAFQRKRPPETLAASYLAPGATYLLCISNWIRVLYRFLAISCAFLTEGWVLVQVGYVGIYSGNTQPQAVPDFQPKPPPEIAASYLALKMTLQYLIRHLKEGDTILE